MPKFQEETEEMIISLGADSPQLGPGGRSSDSESSPIRKAVLMEPGTRRTGSWEKPGWSFSLAGDDDEVFNRDASSSAGGGKVAGGDPAGKTGGGGMMTELATAVTAARGGGGGGGGGGAIPASRSMLQPPEGLDDTDTDTDTEQLQPVGPSAPSPAAAAAVAAAPEPVKISRQPTQEETQAEVQEAWTLLPPAVSPGRPKATTPPRAAQQEVVNALLAGGRSGSDAALAAGMKVAPVVPPVMGPGADMSRGENPAPKARGRKAKGGGGGGGGGGMTMCCGAPVRKRT